MKKMSKCFYAGILFMFTLVMISFIAGIGMKVLNIFFDANISIETYTWFLMGIDILLFILFAVYLLLYIKKELSLDYETCKEFIEEWEAEHTEAVIEELVQNAQDNKTNEVSDNNGFKKVRTTDVVIGGITTSAIMEQIDENERQRILNEALKETEDENIAVSENNSIDEEEFELPPIPTEDDYDDYDDYDDSEVDGLWN